MRLGFTAPPGFKSPSLRSSPPLRKPRNAGPDAIHRPGLQFGLRLPSSLAPQRRVRSVARGRGRRVGPGLARRADRRGGRRLLAGAGGPGPADRPGAGDQVVRDVAGRCAGQGEDPPAHHGGLGADHQGRIARTRQSRETASTRATRTRRTACTRGCRPGPRVYGLAAPVFPPPCVLRGRGRIFPAPARGTPRPELDPPRRVPPRCPRTAINSQRSPPAATCEHEASASL